MYQIQITPDLVFVVAEERKALSQIDTVLALDKEYGLGVEIFGHGRMIDEPVELNGWIVMQVDRFAGIIPQEGLDRMEILKSHGFSNFLIADDLRHERYLPKKEPIKLPEIDWNKVGRIAGIATLVVGGVALVIAALPVILVGGAVMAGAAVGFDPRLLVVLDTGEWVSFYEYYD